MKKILSLTLAVILALGMFTFAFAADGDVYTLGVSGDGSQVAYYQVDDTIRPGDEIQLYIYKNGSPAVRADVRADKIDARLRSSSGSRGVDGYEIKYDNGGNAYLQINIVDPFVSTSDLDIDTTVYLTVNRTRLSETEVQVVGTLENYVEEVDDGVDFVYMVDSPVVEANDYIRSIELELGDGLSIFTRMFDGRKYYGYVTQEIKAEDDEIVSAYPSIDTIYYLSTINLNSASNYIRFDIDDNMYVYNADLEYIGTTRNDLPYSTKYYLSTLELDVPDAEYDDDDLDDDDLDDDVNPDMGGDDIPANLNENPGTGR